MFVCLFHHHTLLELLLFLTLPQQIIARVPINPLSYAVFDNSFNLYDPSGKGGCNRNAPNGAPMLWRVQMSLGGAWALSQTVANDLPNYPSQTYIRGLLFLFFGITFQQNHELNPDIDNVNAFTHIADTYAQVNRVFTSPGSNIYNLKPRYRCLEDYATYYTHMLGSNGQEDTTLPLIGEIIDVETEGGFTRPPPYNDIWPGLMFVYNVDDRSSGWYPPDPRSPQTGRCYSSSSQTVTAITDSEFNLSRAGGAGTAKALFGITLCASHFTSPTLSELGIPIPNGGTAEIERFQKAADLEDLHETMHLISAGGAFKEHFQHLQTFTLTNSSSSKILTPFAPIGIIDQPAAFPPSYPPNVNAWLTDRNWASWYSSTTERTYGYWLTTFLGLAQPLAARLNADSFAIFALCMYFTELDCLGAFQYDIRTKRSSVPVGGLSEKATKRIREGQFDLKRDLPLDRDLGRRARSAKSEGGRSRFREEGESRFRDEGEGSIMFG